MFTFLRKIIEIFKVRISLTITLCAVSGVFIMPYSNSFTFKQFLVLIFCTFLSYKDHLGWSSNDWWIGIFNISIIYKWTEHFQVIIIITNLI